jgi:hypothetical protein
LADRAVFPTATDVKGCPTSARAKGMAAAECDVRAGVGQASREETAGHTAVVGTGGDDYGDLSVSAGASDGDVGDQ